MKIKKGVCVMVAFLLLNQRGFALQCYKCENSDCNKAMILCVGAEEKCLNDTVTSEGGVKTGKGCVADCLPATVQGVIVGFTGEPVCCETDGCNRDPAVSSSSSVATPSGVAALLGVALFTLLF